MLDFGYLYKNKRNDEIVKDRDTTIDIAKGIGILLVVVGHIAVPFYHKLYIPIYLFHMPLFFFLSGMFFHRGNILKSSYKKIRTLIVPYFVFVFLGNMSFFIRDFLFGFSIERYSFWGMFYGGGSPLWFLGSLFCVWFICAILAMGKELLMYIGGGLLLLIGIYLHIHSIRILFLSPALVMLPYFILGYTSVHVKMKNGESIYEYIRGNIWIFLICLILFVFCAFQFSKRPNVSTLEFMGHPWAFAIGAVAGIVLCIQVSSFFLYKAPHGILSRFLSYLGNNSLFILGLHFYVMFHLYFFIIPVVIRLGLFNEGEAVKTDGILNLFVFGATMVLSCLGANLLKKYIPSFFGIKKAI